MKFHEFMIIGLLVVVTIAACAGLGMWAGRTGTQRVAGLQYAAILGMPISTPSNIPVGRRLRLYFGAQIAGDPAFTIVAGRVYRGDDLTEALLTLDDRQVYSGSGTSGPLLYRFDDNQVLAGSQSGPAQFVQRENTIYFGPDPLAPALFTFEGTHVFRGDPDHGRVLATSNTVLNDPDLVKLVTIVLYMETLE